MDPRLGRNMPVEEYLALLDEHNKQKKAMEKADKEKNELEEREKGFNVFVSGANKERAIKQNKINKAKDASEKSRTADQAPRREWNAQSSVSSFGKPNDDQYMNPFETHTESFLSKNQEGSGAGEDKYKRRK
jgi:hypothetical protein